MGRVRGYRQFLVVLLFAGSALAVVLAAPGSAARFRLPFQPLPGLVYLAFLGIPSALSRHTGAGGEGPDIQLGVYGGTAYTQESSLRLIQPGGTDLRFEDIAWEGEPFEAPPYYGLRAIYWLPGSRFGVMGDFTHIKAISIKDREVRQTGTRDGFAVPPREPLATTFRRLEFTHGYNLVTVNLLRRGGPLRGSLVPYAGAGFGVAYPHVEMQRRGAPVESRTYEYQIAGPALQLLGGIEWRFGRRLSLFVEYKLDCAAISGSLVGGGSVDTTLCTHQLLAGPALHLRALAPTAAP